MEIVYNPEHLFKNYYPDETWFKDNKTAKALEYFIWEFSNLNAPQDQLQRINQDWINFYSAFFTECTADKILIVGTGFGVLPLLAARAGKNVYACDRYPVLAQLSKEIIDRNGGEEKERIHFFFKDVKEIKQGEDIPGKCNLLLFDDFDNSLLETGYIPLLEHLKKHLLTPDAVVVPGQATIYARCVELIIDERSFDLSSLARYQWAVGSRSFDPAETKYRWLSETQVVCTLDFSRPVAAWREKTIFPIIADGTWNGIVYWHDLPGSTVYSIQYIDPLHVEEGAQEEITVYQLKTKIRFEPRGGVEKLHTGTIQSWHIEMLNDDIRYAKYYAGIEKALQGRGNCRVLDIGCGCGLLSMMAARIDPESKICGCEVLQALGDTAREIVRSNGFDERISIITSDIRELKLPEKVDYVIHEVVASGMLGEGVLHFLHYAKEHLAQPDACYIPQAARVKAIIVEHWLSRILGIDVEAVNAYRWHPDYSSIDLAANEYKQLSAPFDVFHFDFANPVLEPQNSEVKIEVTAPGTANAIVYWFELRFDEQIVLSSSPFEQKTCWHQAIQYVQGIGVHTGAVLPLKISHDCYKINFEVLVQQLDPALPVSPVACYDAAWYNHVQAVEKKYRQMIFPAVTIEGISGELVEAAIRIASDPGQFGVRSKYASRLAESFFIR